MYMAPRGALDPFNLIILIVCDPFCMSDPWKHTKTHCVKSMFLKTAWGPRYDHFPISCWTTYPQHWRFESILGYMLIYGGIWKYMEVHGGIHRYMKVYKSIRGYMNVYGGICEDIQVYGGAPGAGRRRRVRCAGGGGRINVFQKRDNLPSMSPKASIHPKGIKNN